MACSDMDYALQRLRDAIDFAEIEHDFVPLRKWANEVERSGREMGAVELRLNRPASQELCWRLFKRLQLHRFPLRRPCCISAAGSIAVIN